LCQISAPANLKSSHFLEIRPSPASAKFLAGFGKADLSSGVFAILISVTRTKNSLSFHKFSQKLANSDVTKEALNCTASIAANEIADAISFIRPIVL